MKKNLKELNDIPFNDLLFIQTYKNYTSTMFNNYYKAIYVKNNQICEFERDIENNLTKNDVNNIVTYGKVELIDELINYSVNNSVEFYLLSVYYNDIYHETINRNEYDTLLIYANKSHIKNIHSNDESEYSKIYIDIERDGIVYYKNITLTMVNENIENLKKNIYRVKSTI
jgi:hypothetical protein